MKLKNKLTIKRVHILNAIRFNNLVAGSWFEGDFSNDPHDKIIKPNCNACLVGSAVRRAAKPKTAEDYTRLASFIWNVVRGGIYGITDVTSEESIDGHLAKNRYLSALSCKFETTIRTKAIKLGLADHQDDYEFLEDAERRSLKLNVRETNALLNWVRKNIPVQFTVNSTRDY